MKKAIIAVVGALGLAVTAMPEAKAETLIIGHDVDPTFTETLSSGDDTDYIVVRALAGQRIMVGVESNEIDPYVKITTQFGQVLPRSLTEAEKETYKILGITKLPAATDDSSAAVHALTGPRVNTNASVVSAPVPYSGTYLVVIGNSLGTSFETTDEYYELFDPNGWRPNPARGQSGEYTADIKVID